MSKLEMKKILVPIDFSEASDRALEYGVELARRLDASLVVMHCYEIPVYGIPDGALVATAEAVSRITTASQEGLALAMLRCQDAGAHAQVMLRQGNPVLVIPKVADEIAADVIVMGTHGRKGIARAFLGSVAEGVLRATACPVLAVHAHQEASTRRAVARANA
jgi:nucleotide-binding universal stress UspA family protein